MLNLQLAELSPQGREYTQNLPIGVILGMIFFIQFTSILNPIFTKQITLDFSKFTNFFQVGSLTSFNSLFLTSDQINTDVKNVFNPFQADQSFQTYQEIQSIGFIIYGQGII